VENGIHFGTDGIRGEVGKHPFTPQALINIGKAIAAWSKQKYNSEPKFLIVNDTRISCENIKNFIKTGLNYFNVKHVDAGILPTPANLAILKNNPDFDFGIVISASHNKFSDNGIKIFDKKNSKLSELDEKTIELYFAEFSAEKVNEPSYFQDLSFSPKTSLEFKEQYKQNILQQVQPGLLQGLKIVLDCANGATYEVAPEIFKILGATVIDVSTSPNGININDNCGALHTKTMQKTILENNADFGFAFDGDGDRVMCANHKGEIKDGDDLLAILSTHPQHENLKTVVGTIMTNFGLQVYLDSQNIELIRTSVGDKYIMAKLEEQNLLLGGETSGHIIIKNYLNTGDGIFAALKTLETVLKTNNFELQSFEKYPQVILNVPIKEKRNLSEGIYAQIINEQQQKMNHGRVIVRYSGTENLLRIMTEDKSSSLANNIASTLAQELQKVLN